MMTEDELCRLALQGRNHVLRNDFEGFVQKSFSTINPNTVYSPNWHITLICEYMEACRKGDIRRLIINMPPRMMKSITVSVAWPAFLLGKNPSARIMTASYAAGLSVKHALDSRRIMQAPWYREVFPLTMAAKDQNEKHKFATTQQGHRIATSVGGTATGEGGDFLIMDDPLTPAQAMSASQRKLAIDWFDQTFATRLDDKKKGTIVLVMQRLHEEDLTGHLLEKGNWQHLCLPAIAEKTQRYDFGRLRHVQEAGEVLHSAREGLAELAEVKRELGSFAFAAQYQQNPLPSKAGMVRREWFARYTQRPAEFDRIVQSWDTAVKTGDEHDCSVCLTAGENGGVSYVLDVTALRLEYPALKRQIRKLAELWQPDVVLMEDKASGQSLLQDLRLEKGLPPFIAMMPVADKITRFAAVSAMIEAGKVALPRDAEWLAEFERELLSFPHGVHDDRVDALSQYLGWLRRKQGVQHRIRPV